MKPIVNFFFELGQLARIKHEGWRLAGVPHPESVADHSLRAAQIGYILATLENYSHPEEVCAMLIFHDIAECRIGDLHKIANRYVTVDEDAVVQDQAQSLNTEPHSSLGTQILELFRATEHAKTTKLTAGLIAKDADYLEQAVAAREYVTQGFASAENWIDNIEKALTTTSAKALLKLLRGTSPTDWWKDLKKLS